jgi:hypothetical protein
MGILVAQHETRAAYRMNQFDFMVAIDLSAKSCNVHINDVVPDAVTELFVRKTSTNLQM